MKIALMKLKVTYLRFFSRYYSKKYQKYLDEFRIQTFITSASWGEVTFEKAHRREEYYEFVKLKRDYYQDKLINCNEQLSSLSRELFLIS